MVETMNDRKQQKQLFSPLLIVELWNATNCATMEFRIERFFSSSDCSVLFYRALFNASVLFDAIVIWMAYTHTHKQHY